MSGIKGPVTKRYDQLTGQDEFVDASGRALGSAEIADALNARQDAKRMRYALERVVQAHRDEHDPIDHIGVTPALCCRMAWDAKGGLDGVDVRPDAEREELALLRAERKELRLSRGLARTRIEFDKAIRAKRLDGHRVGAAGHAFQEADRAWVAFYAAHPELLEVRSDG